MFDHNIYIYIYILSLSSTSNHHCPSFASLYVYVQIGSGVVQINTLGGNSTKYLPQMKQTRCKPIMNDVKIAASQTINKLLTDNGCIFNPKKEYSVFLKPPSTHSSQLRLVYMLMQDDDCKDKVGYTSQLFKQYRQLTELHWKLEYAAHYAKFIPRVYFFHKKSRTISTVFLRNSTQKSKTKTCPCI